MTLRYVMTAAATIAVLTGCSQANGGSPAEPADAAGPSQYQDIRWEPLPKYTGGKETKAHLIFLDDGTWTEIEGTEREMPTQLVLLAMGYTGPEQGPLLDDLDVGLDERGLVVRDDWYATNVPGVFVAGDAGRGQSLIVWAIAEGRACAAGVDAYLAGSTTLPAPISPSERPLAV
jgi:hypothetical protein